eukprot:6213476-Pleurochrysis_carterae.AAC.5
MPLNSLGMCAYACLRCATRQIETRVQHADNYTGSVRVHDSSGMPRSRFTSGNTARRAFSNTFKRNFQTDEKKLPVGVAAATSNLKASSLKWYCFRSNRFTQAFGALRDCEPRQRQAMSAEQKSGAPRSFGPSEPRARRSLGASSNSTSDCKQSEQLICLQSAWLHEIIAG